MPTPEFDIMMLTIPLMYFVCFATMFYIMLSGLREAMDGASDTYSQAASRELENLFLFIPAHRISSLSHTVAVVAFVTCFVLIGDLSSPGGMLQGGVAGVVLGSLVRSIPGMIIREMRKRRLAKFNEQLVEAMLTMSNALRAGFSIQQAFETIVQEGRKPIAQEFGVFVQQTRVGVRFEDALLNLEERVGSEDLTLMIRAVEIARQTGGNLTEVFDKIAETIRERTRVEGKIKSMTAMGRLQGNVVGMIPLFLLGAMTMLDPRMMLNFYTSLAGISLMVLVVFLLIIGFLVIRKIVSIEV